MLICNSNVTDFKLRECGMVKKCWPSDYN